MAVRAAVVGIEVLMRLVDDPVGRVTEQEIVVEASPAPSATPLIARGEYQSSLVDVSDRL